MLALVSSATRGIRSPLALPGMLWLMGSATVGHAEVPCAGEGPPILAGEGGYAPSTLKPILPTALLTLAGLPLATLAGRPGSADVLGAGRLRIDRARVGVCGVADHLAYRLTYEPYAFAEHRKSDSAAWGRLTDVTIAWIARPYLVVALGLGKTFAGRGREQPIGALSLPLLPAVTTALAPDRRLGVTADVNLGVARFAIGVHAGARRFQIDAPGGLLLVARMEIFPVGPVDHRAWPAHGAWTARKRVALGATALYRRATLGANGYLVGGDFAFAWRRYFVSAEVLYGRRWPSEQAPPQILSRALGGFAETLVLLWRRALHGALRVDFLDEDLTQRGGFVAVTGGITIALPGPLAQLQAAYTHRFYLAGGPGDDVLLLALTLSR